LIKFTIIYQTFAVPLWRNLNATDTDQ